MGILHDWIEKQRQYTDYVDVTDALIAKLQTHANKFVDDHPGPYTILVKQHEKTKGIEFEVEVEEQYESWLYLTLF